MEYFDRRVRGVSDLVVDGVPVLGVVGPLRDKYTIRQRIEIFRAFVAGHRQRRAAKRSAARAARAARAAVAPAPTGAT
jgi:hypothetical protein